MELLIERIYAPGLIILGLSHMLHPKRWCELFFALRRHGQAGLTIGTFTLPLGLLIILGHNRWVLDWPVFITLSGWGMTIKSIIYLLWPKTTDKLLDQADKLPLRMRLVGVPMLIFGVAISWQAYS